MMIQCTRFVWLVLAVLAGLSGGVALAQAPAPAGGGVTLVKDGQSQAAIVVAPEVMAADAADAAKLKNPAKEAELQRQRLRESVNDLSLYLKKMSGADVPINPAAGSPGAAAPVRILIGAAA